MNIPERDKLENYLREQYNGIFTESMMKQHIDDYIGINFPDQMYEWISATSPQIKKLLDIGSGFGSFVLLCRKRGIDARGIELEGFEIDYARKRLKNEIPQDKPDKIYINGSALELPYDDAYFDAVCMWNVLEHIKDYHKALKEVYRILKPGGYLYIICPNYFALRKEAHYLVPWIPFMPKFLGQHYIKLFGKNPIYYKNSIFHRNNWGLLFSLWKTNFRLFTQQKIIYIEKLNIPSNIVNNRIRLIINILIKLRLVKLIYIAIFIKVFFGNILVFNPFKNSIILHCNKQGTLCVD